MLDSVKEDMINSIIDLYEGTIADTTIDEKDKSKIMNLITAANLFNREGIYNLIE